MKICISVFLIFFVSCKSAKFGLSEAKLVAELNNELIHEMKVNKTNLWCPDSEVWRRKGDKIKTVVKLNDRVFRIIEITDIFISSNNYHCYETNFETLQRIWDWLDKRGIDHMELSLEEYEALGL